MAVFRDSSGREWVLRVNTVTARPVKELTGVNLLDLKDGNVFEALSDPYTLASVLWILCADQAGKEGVNEEQFAAGLVGDPIEGAVDALLAAATAIYPRAKREALTSALQKIRQMESAAIAEAAKRLDEIDVDAAIQATFSSAVS